MLSKSPSQYDYERKNFPQSLRLCGRCGLCALRFVTCRFLEVQMCVVAQENIIQRLPSLAKAGTSMTAHTVESSAHPRCSCTRCFGHRGRWVRDAPCTSSSSGVWPANGHKLSSVIRTCFAVFVDMLRHPSKDSAKSCFSVGISALVTA